MARRIPLEIRTTLLFTALGTLLSLAFAATTFWLAEDYEEIVVDALMQSEVQAVSGNQKAQSPRSSVGPRRLERFLRTQEGIGDVPESIAGLPPGVHEDERDGTHTGVFDTPAGRLFVRVDLQQIEARESELSWALLGVVAFGILLAAMLGRLFARRATLPVRELAEAVESLPERPSLTHFSDGMPNDSLGRLAMSVDDYQRRLIAFEEREQAFLADASHELRTPIAVLRGASELLLEDAVDMPIMQPRLERVDRSIRQLDNLIEVLMRLTRRKVAEPQPVEVHDWLAATMKRHNLSTRDFKITGDSWLTDLPLKDADLVIDGLLRKLLSNAAEGVLVIEMDRPCIRVVRQDASAADLAEGQPASASGRRPRGDQTVSSALLEQLALRMGWHIQVSAERPGQFDIDLSAQA